MLGLKVEAMVGMSLRDDLMPQMLSLAQRTNCRIECRANDTEIWVYPTDTVDGLRDAFDRLYPRSRLITTSMKQPWEREKK